MIELFFRIDSLFFLRIDYLFPRERLIPLFLGFKSIERTEFYIWDYDFLMLEIPSVCSFNIESRLLC
jgi:hypothetical protein